MHCTMPLLGGEVCSAQRVQHAAHLALQGAVDELVLLDAASCP